MTTLRWLEWPTPLRTGGSIRISHAFIQRGRQLDDKTLCNSSFPQCVIVRITDPGVYQIRCWRCDEFLRERCGPHPKPNELLTFDGAVCYAPRWTFEDWTSL
jgi:hypothetical protein